MKPIRLQVPEPTPQEGRFGGYSLKRFNGWLEELPRGQAEPLARELCAALREVNCCRLRKAARFDVVELLRPAVYDAAAMLTREYKSHSQPLPAAERERAALVLALLEELAAGFKLVVNEQLDAALQGQQQGLAQTLQLATQRAILALGRGLMESYRIYSPEPGHLWRDLHALYWNAELYGLQSLPVEGTRDTDETALSVKQAYLRVAVLALANPYHLMLGEAEELYRRIGRWVHFVQVRKPAGGEALPGQFIIDLTSDFPARYIPRTAPSPRPAEPRVLLLDRLVAAIDQQIERSQEVLARSKSSSTLSERMQRDMYIRFREALGGRQERASERTPTVARISLVEGLSGCHFFLNGRRPFRPEEDERRWRERLGHVEEPQAKPDPLAGLRLVGDEGTDDDLPRVGRDRASQFKTYDAEADDVWRKAAMIQQRSEEPLRRTTRHKAAVWNRKNESRGGMALFCSQDCPMQIRVGELLAYNDRDSAKPEDWAVGTVRWLRTRDNGGIELGVKHLADSGYAVGTQAVLGAGKGAEYLRALLLPRVNPLSRPGTLVTPAAVYDVGSVLKLNMRQLVLYVQLTELIETTRMFSHFRYKVVEPPKSEQR